MHFSLCGCSNRHITALHPLGSISQKELSCWPTPLVHFACSWTSDAQTHTMCPVWDLSTFAHHHEFKMHPPPPILFLCGILSHSTTVGYQQLRGSLAHSCHWAFGLCLELLRAREPRSSDCCTSSFLVGAARLHFLWVNTEGCDVSVTEEGETFAPWTLPHRLAKWLDHFTSRSSEWESHLLRVFTST